MNKVLIIGAINIDIITNAESIVKEDSNLSSIGMSFGGVGGNIAFNMASLGLETHMLTVLSTDHFKKLITDEYKNRKIHLHYETFDHNSNIYMAVMNQGEMIYGFNDMELIKEFTVPVVKRFDSLIKSFDTLIIDNNLNLDTLIYLAKTYKDKIIAIDAVSLTKAPKLKHILKYIDYLKVNQDELSVLSSASSTKKQIEELHQQGVKHVIVTNKSKKILDSDGKEIIYSLPKQATNIINSSGCGDAFLSGYMYGVITKKNRKECLQLANNQAYKTLFVKESTI